MAENTFSTILCACLWALICSLHAPNQLTAAFADDVAAAS